MKTGTAMALAWESICRELSQFAADYGDELDAMAGLPVMARVCAVAGCVSGLLVVDSLLSEPACLQRLVNDIEMSDPRGL